MKKNTTIKLNDTLLTLEYKKKSQCPHFYGIHLQIYVVPDPSADPVILLIEEVVHRSNIEIPPRLIEDARFYAIGEVVIATNAYS